MAEVRVEEGESLERALKRFRKKCEQSGILSEIKKRAHYEKPSEKRKRKIAEAKRKMRKKMLKEKRYMG